MRLISPFVDLRLKKSGELFFKRMIERKTVIMKRLVHGAAEKKRFERTKKADEFYPKLPIEEKESYRWISTAEGARTVLSEAGCVTFIGDRESDIYEFLDRIPNQNRMRWTIEQVFRTIKSQGLNVKESQIESGDNLMKLAVLALCAAIQIMQLISAREGTTELKTDDLFTTDERQFLSALLVKVEGKTQKQKNPHAKENLAWASWVIARLGGWHCYTKSEGPPGPIVMGRGLKRFHEMFDGWNLYRDLSTG